MERLSALTTRDRGATESGSTCLHAHAVEHVDHVLSSHITARALCIWTATQARDAAIDGGDVVSTCR